MSDFAVIINYQLPNESMRTIVLDTVNEVSVSGSSSITNQPMVNGDEISDHIFKQSNSMRITGTNSLNGSKGIVLDGSVLGLGDFEELFEELKDKGIQCTIYKVSTKNERDIRFTQRNNMVLESFTWTEEINSLGFTLNFKQILLTNVVVMDVDSKDENLPNISIPKTLSFTDTLVDWNEIDSQVCDILEKESLWTTEFKNFLGSLGESALKALIPSAVAGVLITVMAALNTTPIGWVVTAIAAAGTALYLFFSGIVKGIREAKNKRKYAIEKFEYFKNNEEKNKEELERFGNFINSIHESFEQINDLLKIYQVSENEAQEAVIAIDDDYYIFTFTWDNVNSKYSLKIANIDETITKSLPDVTCALESFDDATSSNALIKTKNNSRVYIMNPSVDKNDLRNYWILICKFKPEDFNNLITDIIKAHIYNDAKGG